jgi:hypothetical protein
MSLMIAIGVVLLSGAVGGIINAIITDNGFVRPREETVDNVSIIRPGFSGNMLLGSVAAFVSWGLYGAYSSAVVYGVPVGGQDLSVSIAAVAGSILIGIGGARWLTNEVDKTLLRTAAVTAAASRASYGDSERISVATPAQAFNIAKQMYHE